MLEEKQRLHVAGAAPQPDLLHEHVGRKQEVSTECAQAAGVKGRPFGGTALGEERVKLHHKLLFLR